MNNDRGNRRFSTCPDVLRPAEAAELLSIGRNTIYKMLKNGQLKSIKIGNQYRIPKIALKEYIETCYNESVLEKQLFIIPGGKTVERRDGYDQMPVREIT